MAKRKPPQDDKEQSKRFEEAARELGVDETGEAFQRALKAVVPGGPAVKKTSPAKKAEAS